MKPFSSPIEDVPGLDRAAELAAALVDDGDVIKGLCNVIAALEKRVAGFEAMVDLLIKDHG